MQKSASTIIISTFATTIIIGAFFLALPFSTVSGTIALEDALFTAASAVTVTGLIVVDTATYFTPFGQTIILILLQIGGLGFMTFSTFTILMMGKGFSLKDKTLIESDFTAGSYRNVKDLLSKIFIITFGIELTGAVVLYFQFTNLSGGHRLFSAIFHSISAFCNAGFSIFSSNFEEYTGNLGINTTLMVLIILGGIGFLVINELFLYARRKIYSIKRISLHSKVVIIASALLIFGGFLVIFIEELLNPANPLPPGEKALSALFQSVSARTAGFNTINLNYFSYASIWIMLILMFIGASPGSTGGGVKTSSVSVIVGYFRSRLMGKHKISFFYRTIPPNITEKAFIVVIISSLLVAFFTVLLMTFESSRLKMIDLIFETISAFGTAGLSMGITSQLTLPSKLIITLTMFIGRIGPLTLLIAMSKQESKAIFRYAEENIMIG
ncbi:MAG: hypothetical protein GY757_32005 [bacterium]|nr:hypothetical protein [bacterium]